MNIRQFLRNLGVLNHPGMRWDRDLEGYRDYTFGCVTGPSEPNIQNLAHELAHAAQFGPEAFRTRARESGFRFRVNRIWVFDRYCVEQRTHQATLRELQTFAYQAHLMEAAGLKLDRQAFFARGSHLMITFMPDWYNIPGETHADQKAWCVEQITRFYVELPQGLVLERLNGWLQKTAKRLARTRLAST